MSEPSRVDCPHCYRRFDAENGRLERHFSPGTAIPCEGRNSPVTRKVSHFDICDRMAKDNLDIRVSSLDNISNLTYQPKRKGTLVSIGIDGDLVAAIALENKYIGGLMLINREQYFATKAKLEAGE